MEKNELKQVNYDAFESEIKKLVKSGLSEADLTRDVELIRQENYPGCHPDNAKQMLRDAQEGNKPKAVEKPKVVKNEPKKSKFNFISIDRKHLMRKKYIRPPGVIGDGVLSKGGNLILAGESGVGKSILRLVLAICLFTGQSFFDFPIKEPHKVLMVQFENIQDEEEHRLRQMMGAPQIDGHPNQELLKTHLQWLDPKYRFNLHLKGGRADLEEAVKDSGADVVIYDPLSSLHQANENDNSQIRAVLDSITAINRKVGTSSIIIHHFGKPSENHTATRYRVRGATTIFDWADSVITISKERHPHKILLRLKFDKLRYVADHQPILLERDKDSFVHTVTEEVSLCTPEQVASILKDMGGEVSSQKELVNMITEQQDCAERSARTYIKNALKEKAIQSYKIGRKLGYRIPTQWGA